MSERGWCPFARQHRGPGEGPFGYPAGARGQAVPVAIYSHRMGGHKRTLDNDRWRHENWVGVNFGIGRYKVGDIDQYANIFDAAWGNGIAGSVPRYDRANPVLAALERKGTWIPRPTYSAGAHSLDAGGVNVLNASGPSIEHEDGYDDDSEWPDPLIVNSIMVHRWIVKEYNAAGIRFVLTEETSIGHFQIDAVNRPACPGSVTAGNWRRAKAKILAGVNQEEDEMKIAPWWTGRELVAGKGDINLNIDFGPAKAYDLRLVVEPVGTGSITFYHGNLPFSAAGVAAAASAPRAASFVLVPGRFGTAPFEVVGRVKIAFLAGSAL